MNTVRYMLLILVEIIFGFIEILLVIRFLFRLFGASSSSTFVSWIYTNTQGLIHPFEGAFPTPVINGFVIEFSSLLALLVYGLVGYFIIGVLLTSRTQREH